MAGLSNDDIDKISSALIDGIKSKDQDFWINAEEHYLDHKDWKDFKKIIGAQGVYDLKQLLEVYRLAKSLWMKAFLGLAIIGTIGAATFGLITKFKGL